MFKILFVALLALSLVEAQDAVFSIAGIDLYSKASPPTMSQLLNGNILLFGGGLNTTVLEYNPIMNVTITRASLPHNIYEACVVTATTGKIYVISGMLVYPDITTLSLEVLIYDPVADSWLNGQNVTSGRARTSCGYDPELQNIHMLGGLNPVGFGIGPNPHVIYSITNDMWRNASNPPVDHGRLGRAYYHPNLKLMVFVSGAFTTAQSAYNTGSDTWTQLTAVPDVTYYFGLVVRPDRVLLLGGAQKNTLFTYFFANDTWTNGTINAALDFDANTAQVGGSVFAIAGDFKMYASLCLVADKCDGPCLSSCVAETGFCTLLSNVTCDDANECTIDDTCQVGVCLGIDLSNTNCTDNDPCTLEDTCFNGVCVAGNQTAVECIPPVAPPVIASPPVVASSPTVDSPPIVDAPFSAVPKAVPRARQISEASILGKSMSLIFVCLCALLFSQL